VQLGNLSRHFEQHQKHAATQVATQLSKAEQELIEERDQRVDRKLRHEPEKRSKKEFMQKRKTSEEI
jgi:hypothetical protein